MKLARWLALLDRPATARFIAISLAVVWFGTFVMWRADYRSFYMCNHDPAAALRMDEIISQGARPGTHFYYYYGLVPVFVSHIFFALAGRTPLSLLTLIFLGSCASYAGIAWTLRALAPTRLGALLIALAAGHATWQVTPTYAMETGVLIWVVALRVHGRNAMALGLGAVALFVKMSMAAVILAELVGLSVFDAWRTRNANRLLPILVVPPVCIACAALLAAWLGVPALRGSFDAATAGAMYRYYDMGFLRQGRAFWHPDGHNVFWYLGGVAGPWCLASAALLFLGGRAALRLVRAGLGRYERDGALVAEEVHAISGFANLAYIVAFYGPPLYGAYYYAWLLVVGVAPVLARARLGFGEQSPNPRWALPGWILLGLFLTITQKTAVQQFVRFLGETRVRFGPLAIRQDEAEELRAVLALGHATGGGVISAIARAANFGLVDPSIRQGHYWMLLRGVPKTKSDDETLALAQTSDAVLVTKLDYQELLDMPVFSAILQKSERLHDGKHFMLLRPAPTEHSP